MLASVTHFTPRPGSFSEGLIAYRAALLQKCLSKLHGLRSGGAATLRARTFLRLGDAEAALSSLAGPFDQDFKRSDRGEIALLQGAAFARLGKGDQGRDLLRDAFVYSVSSANPALEAEVEYYKGLAALGEDSLDDALAACHRGLEVAFGCRTSSEIDSRIPLGHVISRIHELLAVIASSDGRYHDATRHARLSLSTHDACATHDVYIQSFALKNLAIAARDFDLTDEVLLLSQRVPALEWTQDVSGVEFATVEALGWCSALRGDSVNALRLFRRANTVASTIPEHVVVSVDRALLAREFGHRAMVAEEVEYAVRIANGFDWGQAAGDSRDALLFLAQVASATEPLHAREMVDRYAAITNSVDITFAARLEPRARAEEAYTQGLVLRAEGQITASKERLAVAFEIWTSIGYEWRAARAALELAELDAGEVFRLAVRQELFRRPSSIFSGRARLIA